MSRLLKPAGRFCARPVYGGRERKTVTKAVRYNSDHQAQFLGRGPAVSFLGNLTQLLSGECARPEAEISKCPGQKLVAAIMRIAA